MWLAYLRVALVITGCARPAPVHAPCIAATLAVTRNAIASAAVMYYLALLSCHPNLHKEWAFTQLL